MASLTQKKFFKTSDYNHSELSVTPLDVKKQKKDSIQLVTWLNYGKGKFIFSTDLIKMTTGLPSLGQYYKDDSARRFIKVPLDQAPHLMNMLGQMDEYMVKNKKNILGKKYAKLFDNYIKCVRTPVQSEDLVLDEDEEDKKVEVKKKTPYVKFKLDFNYETGVITTPVYCVDRVVDPVTQKEKEFQKSIGNISY